MVSVLTRPPAPAPARSRRGPRLFALPEMRWASLALLLFAIGGALQVSDAPTWSWWAAYLTCYAAGGWEPGLAGLQALRAKTLDVDLLMIVAAVVAACIGQVFDGALLIVIFSTSGALEALATRRTRDSVNALLDLAPEHATRLSADGERVVGAADLVAGDVILVRPGERIGGDGDVIDGRSEVDESSITGEPLPGLKEPGSGVFAGTMNGTGALRVRITSAAKESVISRIVAMVEQASETKARTQLFIETVEQRYSVGMVAATLALLLLPLVLGAELEPTLLRAITFMIVASPCAVVLATMPPLLSAIANAGRHGVLVKSAVAMEQLAAVDMVALDKTGTLTRGTPIVTQVAVLPGIDVLELDILRLAAAAEQASQHPLGAAIVILARSRGIEIPDASEFASTPGVGVQALVEGRVVAVTAPELPDACESPLAQTVRASQATGATAVVVDIDGRPHAVISLIDEVRDDAASAIVALRRITGRDPILLTGDNQAAADRLTITVGIHDVRAGLLPEGKVDAVRSLQAAGRTVMLVGDGVNDAPAMAAANLGVAMGRRGSDLALQTADAVVVRDQLAAIPSVIDLARRAQHLVIANLVIAATVIAALVAWDLIGNLPLPLGVAGHEGSTVIVGLNGLRMLRTSAWRVS